MAMNLSVKRRGKRTRRAAMAEINVTPLAGVMLGAADHLHGARCADRLSACRWNCPKAALLRFEEQARPDHISIDRSGRDLLSRTRPAGRQSARGARSTRPRQPAAADRAARRPQLIMAG